MERILLLLEQPGNRRVLEEWLGHHYQIVPYETGLSFHDGFDLAILDGPSLERQWPAIQAKKKAVQPVFLPFLLLSPRRDVGVATQHLWQTIDELLTTPVDKVELRARVEILLRARKQSLDLQQRNDELGAFIEARRAVERMKDEFISMAGHELRTPLTSIKLHVNLLLDGEVGDLSEEQRSFLRIVSSNTDRLINLVNDLLDVSRIESDRVQLAIRDLDLGEVVQSVCQEMRTIGESRRIQTAVTLPPEPVRVQADRDRVVQVLTNLLSNAYKYSPEETVVTVRLSVPGQQAQVDVADRGIGITELDRAQLFTKFFRTDTAKSKGIGGTGLGLYIARSLVERQGGEIWVTGQPGEGSTFSFTLPLVPAAATG